MQKQAGKRIRSGMLITLCSSVLLVAVMSGCSASQADSLRSSSPTVDVTVSAAASMKDALSAVEPGFEEAEKAKGHPVKLLLNFASSGTLQHQIEEGAPSDVFLSASMAKMDALISKGLIDKQHVVHLLRNDIVLIVPTDSKAQVTGFSDLTESDISKIAIGIPATVPAGKYGMEVLQHLNLWKPLQSKLVDAKDVRGVLQYVETGNVDAGLVYRTDALITSKVRIAATAPKGSHTPIVYPAGLVKSSKHHKEAEALLQYLQTGAAADVFQKFGFGLAKP